MKQKLVRVNQVDIYTESFGNPKDPAVLLIMGAMSSLDWWDEAFCERLAKKGRFVIRYDHRDLGESTVYSPGTSNYTIADLADDAFGVLDSYSIEKAHITGMSLGGMIGQIMAVKHPDRILSLTVISSSVFGTEQANLPQMDQRILDYHSKSASLDWSDREAAIAYLAGGWEVLSGSKPYEKERMFMLAERELSRAKQIQSRFNYVLLGGGEEYLDRMKEIKVPVTIIHGTEDPALPFEHAQALNRAIPHSELVKLEGSGHEIHSDDWDTIIENIVKLSSSVSHL
ncbi:alpha/beta fold hydrolase [Fictibacillus phosphorivorans]|uniref:alpha/beta fold hydrolase n=1 Tax=Fictibacillus phosphorivorans TaxID=1221500 RepID=UPI00203B1EEE|nr:alpha/beta hydrolase [Fictibacillus phosphorivorans]MCM3718450.1 alpha/beta fold hydrolase [Fictibacillus phosphorivorans]MCM3776074.1 alpha/beta fold hydrolase [Fictibacillus phosphorivorans]